jgi:hypothetical protein
MYIPQVTETRKSICRFECTVPHRLTSKPATKRPSSPLHFKCVTITNTTTNSSSRPPANHNLGFSRSQNSVVIVHTNASNQPIYCYELVLPNTKRTSSTNQKNEEPLLSNLWSTPSAGAIRTKRALQRRGRRRLRPPSTRRARPRHPERCCGARENLPRLPSRRRRRRCPPPPRRGTGGRGGLVPTLRHLFPSRRRPSRLRLLLLLLSSRRPRRRGRRRPGSEQRRRAAPGPAPRAPSSRLSLSPSPMRVAAAACASLGGGVDGE